MKRIFLFLLAIMQLSAICAQNENDTLADDGETQIETTAAVADAVPMNIVKLNLSSLVVKNISLQYERILTKKMSVGLGIRLMPKGALPFKSTIESLTETDDANGDDEVAKFLNNAKVGGFAITPEFRYYLSKRGYGHGFYVAPFVRYERFNVNSIYVFTDDKNVSTDINFKGNYSTLGIGFMLGSQFSLGNRVTLDWWILGPYYTGPRINLEASGYNLSAEDQDQLRQDLEDTKIEIGNFKFESKVDGNSATVKTKGSLAAIRGFGLCIGIRL